MVDPTLTKLCSRRASIKSLSTSWLCLAVITGIGLLVTSIIFSPTSPPDLSTGHRMLSSGLISSWRDGDVIVLIRHEERCDRSSNPCMGPADGLTIAGTVAAATLGKSFQTLGMANSDVLSSPATRTAQTALFMFSKTGLLPNSLAICGNAMAEKLIAHKADGRNLLLLTHNTCISDLETELGFPRAAHSEYGSALFVKIDTTGKLQVLGSINAKDWPPTLKETPHK